MKAKRSIKQHDIGIGLDYSDYKIKVHEVARTQCVSELHSQIQIYTLEFHLDMAWGKAVRCSILTLEYSKSISIGS